MKSTISGMLVEIWRQEAYIHLVTIYTNKVIIGW